MSKRHIRNRMNCWWPVGGKWWKADVVRERSGDFFARYKGLSRWHSRAWQHARAKATEVRTRLGRRGLIPPEASERERFTTLMNTEVQGGAADGMKLALVDLAPWLPPGVKIINTIHDELIVEAPAELAGHVRDLTQTVMIESMARLCPEGVHRSGGPQLRELGREALNLESPIHPNQSTLCPS